jgi:hypothetical protein
MHTALFASACLSSPAGLVHVQEDVSRHKNDLFVFKSAKAVEQPFDFSIRLLELGIVYFPEDGFTSTCLPDLI